MCVTENNFCYYCAMAEPRAPKYSPEDTFKQNSIAARVSALHSELTHDGMKLLRFFMRHAIKSKDIIAYKRIDNLLALSRIPTPMEDPVVDACERIAASLDEVQERHAADIEALMAYYKQE